MLPALFAVLTELSDLDSPPPWDMLRFPPAWVADEQMALNRRYRTYLEHRQQVEPAAYWALAEALADAERRHAAWDALRWARLCREPGHVRAQLQALRAALGEADYRAARMPEPVPVAGY